MTNLQASNVTSTQATLTWDPYPNASYYVILRGTAPGNETAYTSAPASPTTFQEDHLTPGSTYSYQVLVYVNNEYSFPSNEVIVNTPGAPTLQAPTNVSATAISTSRITLSWTPVANALGYYIYQSEAGGPFNYVGTAPPSESSRDMAGLAAGTTYSFYLQTVFNAGLSPPSTTASATTFGAATLPPPANVSAVATSSSRITVSWSPSTNALGYEIYQSQAGGPFAFIGTAAAGDTSRIVAGLTAATTYSFYLQTVYAGGTSAPSTTASATTFGTATGVVEGTWRFDEQMGTTANDSSGFNRHGTLTGAVGYVNDKFHIHDSRSALSSSGGAVVVPAAPGFDLYTDFTVALWAKVGAGAAVHFIGVRDAGCGAGWDIAQDATNLLHFRGGPSSVLSFGQSLPADTWTHIAVTSTAGTLRLYLNGVQVATGALTVDQHLANSLQIGNAGSCPQSGTFVVDDVSIQSRALSAGEIATAGTPPPAPTNLVATVVSSTRVDLRWDPVPNAELYIIYRGTGPGTSQFFTTWPGDNPTFDYNHLTPSTTYSWQVRAVRNGLRSGFSNEQVVTTQAPPAAPTNVVATPGAPTRLNVSWTTVAGATHHYIYQSVNGGAFQYLTTTYSSPTFEAAGLTTGATYSYKIQAITAGGISAESAASAPVAAP